MEHVPTFQLRLSQLVSGMMYMMTPPNRSVESFTSSVYDKDYNRSGPVGTMEKDDFRQIRKRLSFVWLKMS